jgi:hypothetical protein
MAIFSASWGKAFQRSGLTSSMISSKINIILDEFRPEESSPERTLFLCVLLQALLDATKEQYDGEPVDSRIDRDRAVAWFFASVGTTARDFEEVCSHAGVDADYMRDFAYKVLKSGEIEYVRRRINAVLGH